MGSARGVRRLLGRSTQCALLGALLALGALGALPSTAGAVERTEQQLYLVTLDGPGLAGGAGPAARLEAEQDRVLRRVSPRAPVYRWTHALNGMAVRLSETQAARLATVPGVARVEPNSLRRLAAGPPDGFSPQLLDTGRTRGGAGVVIGFVDTGIDPEHPLFGATADLGTRTPADFRGHCRSAPDWPAAACSDKLVGTGWFVTGFGVGNLSSSASLSARDDDGHGTQVASVAAGNAGLPVEVAGSDLGQYAGLAPQARVAAYKACWIAPDPADDGCATADLVSAIDRATADGVDVLNLSVDGPARPRDTVSRALLGAAEAGIVVVTAAGNGESVTRAGPWVTTVGAAATRRPQATVAAGDTVLATGLSATTATVGPAPVVLGEDAAVPGTPRRRARICAPGSLDASVVAGHIVLCQRGAIGRVDKSRAVRAADGVGMVLGNPTAGSRHADLHAVPTVHLDAAATRDLRRWVARHPRAELTIAPAGSTAEPPGVAPWSPGGTTSVSVLPDLLAPGTGLLAGVPEAVHGRRWDVLSGTSASAAYTSGVAARLLAARDRSAAEVRSALATSANPVDAGVARAGAGLIAPRRVAETTLVVTERPQRLRAWLDREAATVNTPSIVVSGPRVHRVASRVVTHVGDRPATYAVEVSGFEGTAVTVSPVRLRLSPGERATFTVRVTGRSEADGAVTWHGSNGSRARIPVAVR